MDANQQMIVQQFTPEEFLNKYMATERDRDRAYRMFDLQLDATNRHEKYLKILKKQHEMAKFIAMLTNTAEFKRFAEFCGEYTTAAYMKELKTEMIENPDKYLDKCTEFNVKKRKDEQKKKDAAKKHANKRPRDEGGPSDDAAPTVYECE